MGKTALITSYITNSEVENPFMVDNVYVVKHMVNGAPVFLTFWDMPGNASFDALRSLEFAVADVFLICFSLVNQASLDNVGTKWYPEVSQHCPGTPIILVGTQSDLKDDLGDSVPTITRSQVLNTMNDTGLLKYRECSAVTHNGIRRIVHEAIQDALMKQIAKGKQNPESEENGKCCCM